MATGWVIEQLFVLLNERLSKSSTTIITSNLDLSQTQESLIYHLAAGEADPDFRAQAGRIAARIREAAQSVLVDGPALAPEPAASLPW
jgi:DNA replication protein DnaC